MFRSLISFIVSFVSVVGCCSYEVSAQTVTLESNSCLPNTSATFSADGLMVVAISSKNLSNVVVKFCDGTLVKFEDTGTSCVVEGSSAGATCTHTDDDNWKITAPQPIVTVWVKSGCNSSGDGPGFGDRIDNPTSSICTKDCLGNYGGSAVLDQCGVCGGDNSTCTDCEGTINGGKVSDKCGVCGGDGTSCDLVGICVLLGYAPDSLIAKPDVLAKPIADDLVARGLATYGSCTYVDICVKDPDGPPTGMTQSVATITLQNWLNKGAKEGACEQCPNVDQCTKQCIDFFPNDPAWVPRCIDLCVRDCGSFCDPLGDSDDCPYELLESRACAEVNGFLGQVNIATITNLTMGTLNFEVSYRDLTGDVKGVMNLALKPNIKSDIPVSALGLVPDSYGTLCVQSELGLPGLWTGSISAYKQRPAGDWDESGEFEYALHYPFENAKTAIQTAPLNTFSVGSSKVANWVRITDAKVDGQPLEGALFIYQSLGSEVTLKHIYSVNIADGGRFDFSGHDQMDPDRVGQAIFVPYVTGGATPKFYFNTARYFYECPGANPFGCNNFLSAFVVPPREPTQGKILDDASIQGFDLGILELVNPVGVPATVQVTVTGLNGAASSPRTITLAPYQVSHLDVTLVPDFYNTFGSSVTVDAGTSFVTAVTSKYDFTSSGVVNYGVSSPLTKAKNSPVTMSEFNSFLKQANTLKLVNSTDAPINATVDYTDHTGALVFQATPIVPANGQATVSTSLPEDSYGTITVHGQGLVVRNITTKPSVSNPAVNEFSIIHTGK